MPQHTPIWSRILASPLLALLLAVVLTASSASTPVVAQGDRLQVMVSFSVLADVVRNVAGDAADVETLIPLGANPHSYEPSAQDVVRLSTADAVFIIGLNFEERLQKVVYEAAEGTVYELWGCLPIRPVLAGLSHEHEGEDEHAEDEQVSATPAGGPGIAGSSLDTLCADHWATVRAAFGLDDLRTPGAVTRDDAEYLEVLGMADPHVWTDPVNVALWTLMIRDMLSAEDPAHADVYAANAAAYVGQLTALHADLSAQFAALPAERRYLVTNHESFSYLAARYGLTVVGVVLPGGGTASEPSVQELLTLIETVRQYDVPAVFTETTVSDSLAQQIAEETGAKLIQLYTGSLSQAGGPTDTYLNYMRYNAAQIVQALQ
jgi:ABC-type Zn uptake system ZnuABC Zn-binding protein ZnuA